MFIVALFIIAKICKDPKCVFNGWVDKDVMHLYKGIWFSHKKEIPPFGTTWMVFYGFMLSEVREMEKKNSAYYYLYVES